MTHIGDDTKHRGCVLLMGCDGFEPFKKKGRKYSMWPLTVAVVDLPPWLRNKTENTFLMGLFGGPHKPHNFQPALKFLCNRMDTTIKNGASVYDAKHKEIFKLRWIIMGLIADSRGK